MYIIHLLPCRIEAKAQQQLLNSSDFDSSFDSYQIGCKAMSPKPDTARTEPAKEGQDQPGRPRILRLSQMESWRIC